MSNRFPNLRNPRRWIFSLIGGIIFAAFDRCGYLLKNYGSIWVISENPWHRNIWIRVLVRVPFYTILFFLCMIIMDGLWRQSQKERGWTGGWKYFMENKFCYPVLWFLFFLSFLPAFLGGFPGLFAADAPNQVGWTFSGFLTAHHPLLHTGILCGIFSICRGIGWSDNTAAAIYTILQMFVLSGIFAWIVCFLKKEKESIWLQIGTVFFLFFFPFHSLMAIYTTKDTIFAGIFVLCLIQIYRMCNVPSEYFSSWFHMFSGEICFVFLLLFRNNGFHTLILCFPFLLFYLKKYWKKLSMMFLGVLLIYQIYNGPFLKLIGAEPGNAREAYNIIIQTLGRTYTAGGDIRSNEMEIIRPVMDEETLGQYLPNLSDPMKNYFHTEEFEKNKLEFIKTWLEIGWRNKKIYIDAFLNTTYEFWYPWAENEYLEFVCFNIEEENPNYPHVTMHPISQAGYQYYSKIGTDAVFRRIPILREIFSMGFYFWLLVFVGLYTLYIRDYQKLLWILPCFTYMATNMLGPTALLRYAYPIMLSAPLLFVSSSKKKAISISQAEWKKLIQKIMSESD